MGEHADRLEAIFYGALERPTAQRDAFVREACGSDAGLRHEVVALLHADSAGPALSGTSLLDRPPTHIAQSLGLDRAASLVGMPGTIGPYRLVERIGSGGFADVFLAEQKEPVRRRVAVKVLRAGMDSLQVLARFEAERQAMALMEHPGIAQVFDAGQTDQGRPYVVMEYVPGQPITRYADKRRLSIPARVELLARVCDAVQHAHQKGVIHRDLKPANIIVQEFQSADHTDAQPKIIDFGIAKAIAQPLTQRTLITEHGQLLGTPEYMSPEQLSPLGPERVDTRSDVYSLGVVLYELLTGSLPSQRGAVPPRTPPGSSSPDAMPMPTAPSMRVSRGTTAQGASSGAGHPAPGTGPSAASSAPAADRADVAALRSTTARELRQQLRHDLDWIALRALEPERGRRYGTAEALGADLRRYMRGEVVEAGPPSALYRVRKFAARHRGPMAAATMAVIAVLAALIATSVAWRRAASAAVRADAAAYAATVNLIANSLRDPRHSSVVARALARELEPHQGAWEQRYINARIEASLWSVPTDGTAVLSLNVWRGAAPPIIIASTTAGNLHRIDARTQRVAATGRFRPPSEGVAIRGTAFSGDGSVLLSGDDAGQLAWSDPLTLEPRARLELADRVAAVAYSQHLSAFLAATANGQILIVDPDGAGPFASVEPLLISLAIDTTGRYAVAGCDATDARPHTHIIDLATGVVTPGPPSTSATAETIPGTTTALFKRLDVESNLHALALVDLTTGLTLDHYAMQEQIGRTIAVVPDASLAVYTAPYGNTLIGVDLLAGGRTHVVGEHDAPWVFATCFLSDNMCLSGGADGTIAAWDARLERGVRTIVAPDPFTHAMLHDPRRGWIGRVSGNHVLRWFDIRSGTLREEWNLGPLEGSVSHAVLLPDQPSVLVQTSCGEVLIYKAGAGASRWLLGPSGPSTSMRLSCDASTDGRFLAGVDRGGLAHVWDARTLELIHSAPFGDRAALGVQFTPDSSRMIVAATGPQDGTLDVLDTATWRAATPPIHFDGSLTAFCLDSAGTSVAVGSASGHCQIVRLRDGARTVFGGVARSVHTLCLTSDGTRLIAGIDASEIVVWDTHTGLRLMSLPGPSGIYRQCMVTLTPDGTLIAAGGNRIQIHPVAAR